MLPAPRFPSCPMRIVCSPNGRVLEVRKETTLLRSRSHLWFNSRYSSLQRNQRTPKRRTIQQEMVQPKRVRRALYFIGNQRQERAKSPIRISCLPFPDPLFPRLFNSSKSRPLSPLTETRCFVPPRSLSNSAWSL